MAGKLNLSFSIVLRLWDDFEISQYGNIGKVCLPIALYEEAAFGFRRDRDQFRLALANTSADLSLQDDRSHGTLSRCRVIHDS